MTIRQWVRANLSSNSFLYKFGRFCAKGFAIVKFSRFSISSKSILVDFDLEDILEDILQSSPLDNPSLPNQRNPRTLNTLFTMLLYSNSRLFLGMIGTKNLSSLISISERYKAMRYLWRKTANLKWDYVFTENINKQYRNAKHIVRIHYDYRPGLNLKTNHFILPYGMIEQVRETGVIDNLDSYRNKPKKIRIAFAGASNPKKYNCEQILTDGLGVITRFKIIKHVIESLKPKILDNKTDLETAQKTPNASFVVTRNYRIPSTEWMEFVASADFFLCPPGIIMPMCHNSIESLSLGTIPITNYPHWFIPPLTNGVNCLSFETLDELDRVIKQALTMDPEAVDNLRKGAIRYYNEYLEPKKAMQQIIQCDSSEIHLHVLDETIPQIRSIIEISKNEPFQLKNGYTSVNSN